MAAGNPLPPLAGLPAATASEEGGHSTNRSIETLVVVLAVITLIGVIAGIIARLCGGREHGEEGCVERRCRSCIEAGVDTASPPLKEEPPKPAATQEPNK